MKYLALKFLKQHSPKILSAIFFVILFSAYVNIFAVFSPGDTLDPNCAPGTVGCIVESASTDLSDTINIARLDTINSFTKTINLRAGSNTAGTAPIKFTSGTLLDTTEAGAIEFDGSHLYLTLSNGGPRYQIDQQGGSGSMVYPSAGIAISTGTGWGASIANNSSNWNTAYSQTRQWDGGSIGLVAATGRASLGLGTAALNNTGDFVAYRTFGTAANSATTVPGYTVALSSTGTANGCVSAGGGEGAAATCTATIPAGNTGVTASYSLISYTYNFAGNGATVAASPASVTQNYGSTITAPTSPSRTGYSFAGWSPAVPTTMPIGGGTSNAQWSIRSFNVTFNGNGSDGGSTATQSIVYNTPTALTSNGYTRTGYTFAGWNTAANGGGTAYANTASYTIGAADVTLYAQWTINSYLITVSKTGTGGGTITSSPVGINCGATCSYSYNYNTSLTLTATPDGSSIFSGWSGDADCTDGIVTVTNAKSCIATFTAKQLTIGAPTSLTLSKVYDNNTTVAVTPSSLVGVYSGDVVTVSAVATYDNANVGTGKTITVVYTLGGVDAAKYTKPVDYTVNTGIITVKQLTITSPTVTASKVYDGNTSAAVTAGTLSGVLGVDVVTVSAVSTYDTANVGTTKTITTVYTLAGAQAGNYNKPLNDSINTGVITTKQLTITAPNLTTSKSEDGSTTAAVTPGTLVGVVSPDVINVTATATYDTASVGTGKTITVVYSISGTSVANYIKPVNYVVNTGVILDVTPPTVALSSSTSDPTTGPINVTATFSESVSNFILSDISVTNGTAGTFAGSGTTYTFVVTPTTNGTVTINILTGVATDAAGNPNVAAIAFSRTYIILPVVNTQDASSINTSSITVNGEIINTGSSINDKRGVVYDLVSHSSNPGNVAPTSTLYPNKVEELGSFNQGVFKTQITGLSQNTTYYVRAYTHNNVGYSYGIEKSFKTGVSTSRGGSSAVYVEAPATSNPSQTSSSNRWGGSQVETPGTPTTPTNSGGNKGGGAALE